MATNYEEKKKLLARNTPESKRVRDTLIDYLSRTGLTHIDFGHRINYSSVAMRFFLGNEYHRVAGNDLAIRAAIMNFIEAHPVDAVEDVEGRLHETENVRLLRKYFTEALNRGRAYYVEGDPGTQKSFVLRYFVAELNRSEMSKNGHGRRAYYVYCPVNVRPLQLIKLIAESCGVPTMGDMRRLIRNLRFDFRSRRVLLVLDEAQHLDVNCLEAIRELHDLPPHFGLLFAGSHQLERMFASHALELEQWNSRFHAGRRLPGITEEEAAQIVRAELGAISQKVIEKLISGSRAKALSSKGEHEYLSARRLFNAIHDLQDAAPLRGKAASA
jgi:Cdc6-like AAA superfamily ATPase